MSNIYMYNTNNKKFTKLNTDIINQNTVFVMKNVTGLGNQKNMYANQKQC